MWPHLMKKWLYLALDYFEKNIAKKYQKQQFVIILWQILRPKPAMLPNFWDHISIVSCSLLFLWQGCQQSVGTCKFGFKISNEFLQKWEKKMAKKVVVKDTKKT